MPIFNFEEGPTREDISLLLKTLVWKYSTELGEKPVRAKVFITESELQRAKDRLEGAIFATQDPWGIAIEVIDAENDLTEKIREVFGNEVPAPDSVRRAFKRVYGVDL